MKTMREEWDDYFESLNEIDPLKHGLVEAMKQEEDARRAFFSGASTVFKAFHEINKLPEEQAAITLRRMEREILETLVDRMQTLRQRN